METLRTVCGGLLEARGGAWTAETEDLLARYAELLLHFNRSMNLIGPLDRAQIYELLFRDSLLAAAACPAEGRMADIGSGAGLPGLVMKIARPGLEVTLCEPRKKRTSFLRIAISRLGLKGITVHQCRVEDLGKGGFDVAVSKAFQPPVDWVETAKGLTHDAGTILCLSREGTVAEIAPRVGELGLALRETIGVGVDDRAILVYGRAGADDTQGAS